MACFHPLEAMRRSGGVVVLGAVAERRLQALEGVETFKLPCGKCVGCRSARAQAWAIRCVHESKCHDVSSFVTLTYDDSNCPMSLDYKHFQRFMYRVRKKFGPVRFFACGEYGDLTNRPHFHALLFGLTFRDGVACGEDLYSSATLSKLWPYGFSSFGDVTYQSAGYVARYSAKKVNGPIADIWYSRVDVSTGELVTVEPEFGHMSLKPGIGYPWFAKYWREVFGVRDGIVMSGGTVIPPPRFYFEKLKSFDADLHEEVAYNRYVKSQKFIEDCSPERLLSREICAKARESFRRRSKV